MVVRQPVAREPRTTPAGIPASRNGPNGILLVRAARPASIRPMPYRAPRTYPPNVPTRTITQPFQPRTAPTTRAGFTTPNPKPLLEKQEHERAASPDEGAEQCGRPGATRLGPQCGNAEQDEHGRGKATG